MPVHWSPRTPALVSGLVSLLVLVLAFVLDGTVVHCNDYEHAICTGIRVPWLGLSVVLLTTAALALVASVLPERLYRRWRTGAVLVLGAGCLASGVLVLQTGAVPR